MYDTTALQTSVTLCVVTGPCAEELISASISFHFSKLHKVNQ